MNNNAIFIHTFETEKFEEEVNVMLKQGWDLYFGMVVGAHEIGQWMCQPVAVPYQYMLVTQKDAEAFEALVRNFLDDGWDLYQPSVYYKGQWLQWVSRSMVASERVISLDEFLERR